MVDYERLMTRSVARPSLPGASELEMRLSLRGGFNEMHASENNALMNFKWPDAT